MIVFASLLTLLALSGPAPMSTRPAVAPPDSVGQEMRGSQRFLKHRVAAGETLFGLARRYKVTVDQLTAANPQLKNGLAVGQVVAVPRPSAGKVPAAPATKTPTTAAKTASPAAGGTHTVVKGETLFSIARRYNMSPAELAKLNNLSTDAGVRLGQKLTVSGDDASDNTPTPAVTYQPKTAAEPKAPSPDPAKPAQVATVTPATPAEKAAEKEAEKEEDRSPTRASEVVTRVTESGMGAPIDKSVTDKYLALHKTAPVGTIMQVKNAGNGQSVYVRVIGKLPDTGENNSVLVRLSPRAMQKLGTADSKFRVETSYVP